MLNSNEMNQIIECIKNGIQIPEGYKDKLFPTSQVEYELTYSGKMRKEDLLSNEDGTFPVPIQLEKEFNQSGVNEEWRNMIVFGDNLQLLKTIRENKDPLIKDKVKGKVKLIYIDPPFATTDEFKNKDGAKAYNDKKKGAEFVEFIRRRLILAKELLSEDGSIYVHLDERMAHYIRVILDEVFGKERFVSQIIWNFNRIGGNAKKFEKHHEVIFWYSKRKEYIFNKDDVRQPYEKEFLESCKEDEDGRLYYTRGMGKDGDRLNRKKISYVNPNGKSPSNVWKDISYNASGKKEKTGYPTQKPEQLLKRIIMGSTNENDLVMDFFGGSGTTAAVAEKLNRKWIVCDFGKLSYFTMQKRILQIKSSKSLVDSKKTYGKEAKDFITCTLGLYDLKRALELEGAKYIEFVSGLFGINIKKKMISGFEFDGEKDGYYAKIFDYKKYKNSAVDQSYIEEIHSIIGHHITGRVYIIAPANYVEFLTDYYEIDDVRYYFLKIPYQMIKELHQKPFQKYRQPQSKSNVNELDESIGFHFIRQPEVISEIIRDDNKSYLVVKRFRSNELESDRSSEEKQLDEFEMLSAIFIDESYNGSTFQMTNSYFADELKLDKENRLIVPVKMYKNSKQLMVVYTDIYGNDFTEVIKL